MQDTLAQNYAKGAFGGALTPGRHPALLMIDFVEAYLAEASPLYAAVETTREAAITLLRTARLAAVPIVHTYVEYEPGGRNGGIFYRKLPALRCFERGAYPQWCAFTAGLEPSPGETVICKQYASAFFGTSLASQLTAMQVDTVLIGGLSTSGCVRASAVDCCQHGFVPLVVREAVGDRSPEPHEANLFDLQAKYAEVVSLSLALKYLAQVR